MKKLDIRGYLFHYYKNIKLSILKNITSLLNILLCRLKNISIGNNCKFYGFTYFHRKPKSSIEIGSNCEFRSLQISNLIGINRKCSISTLSDTAVIKIGINCGFSGTIIGAFDSITIGNNVRCGANTLITDGDWHYDDVRTSNPKSVSIGDCVWLGANVVVLKGVTIGSNSIIGINSIVTNDIPANVVAAGNPCKILK